MAKAAQSVDSKRGYSYPSGYEDLTDKQKVKEAEKAMESARNGNPVEPNSIGSFAVAWQVEKVINKNVGKKKKKSKPIVGTAGVNNKFAEEAAEQEDATEAA